MNNDKEVLPHLARNHANRHSSVSSISSSPSLVAAGDNIEDQISWRQQRKKHRQQQEHLAEKGGRRRWGKTRVTGRRRALPAVVLTALVVLLLASGLGIASSVISILRRLSGNRDFPYRVVVFVVSVFGVVYVLLHLAAARTGYRKRGHGAPHLYGNYLHAVALLIARLGIPIWIAAVVTTALAVAEIGVDLSNGVSDASLTIYINCLLSITGLLANCVLLVCIEVSETPFATLLVSKSSFLRSRMQASLKDSIRVIGPVPPHRTVVQSSQQSVQQPAQPPPLSSSDRAQGTWPVQKASYVSSSIPSTDLRAPARPRTHDDRDDGLGLVTASPIEPPRAALSPPPMTAPAQPGARSPVHMSWLPPSRGRKSMDATSAAAGHDSAAAAAISAPPYTHDPRVPTIANVLEGLQGGAQDRFPPETFSVNATSSSKIRMTWTPIPPHHQRRPSTGAQPSHPRAGDVGLISPNRARRHTMVIPRSALGTLRGGGSGQSSYPTSPGLSTLVPVLRLPPRLGSSAGRSTTAPPSPRARSLSSHPPFADMSTRPKATPTPNPTPPVTRAVTATNLMPVPTPPSPSVPSPSATPSKTASSDDSGFGPKTASVVLIRRPQTAPGSQRKFLLSPATASHPAPPPSQQPYREVERKPESSRGRALPATAVTTVQSQPSEWVQQWQEEERSGSMSGPSRTRRRMMKDRERQEVRSRDGESGNKKTEHGSSLRRVQTVNNFSRPFPKTKSLVNAHQRSVSNCLRRSSISIIRGEGA